jgi:hypothetical protein
MAYNRDSGGQSHGNELRIQVPKAQARFSLQSAFLRIRAEVLYRETVGPEALTPAEVALEYDVPLEAVLEAIDYCNKHKELLDKERAREEASIKSSGRDEWPYTPARTATSSLGH